MVEEGGPLAKSSAARYSGGRRAMEGHSKETGISSMDSTVTDRTADPFFRPEASQQGCTERKATRNVSVLDKEDLGSAVEGKDNLLKHSTSNQKRLLTEETPAE